MIVCICRVVTDRTIQSSIDAGARSLEDVAASCRAGTGCGACREVIATMIDQSCRGACEGCPRGDAQVASAAAAA